MTLLPIVAREMRVASRRAATYWTRFTFAMLAIVVGSFAWAIATAESPKKTGFALFVTFSVVAYIYSLIAGALWTADSVSEEKRDGTLGLLFLTDLKSYDIVLGKLAASSVTAVYGLLAIFPVMAVPQLLGGVAPAEFWRVVLVCVNNLFLSLATGMLCSALCKDERKSIGLTLLIMLFLTAGIPAAAAWVASEIPLHHALRHLFHEEPFPLMLPSPGFTCVFAFDEPYKDMLKTAKVNWFYPGVAFTHLMGWFALLLTAYILPRIWQDKAATAQALKRREQWNQFTGGPAPARAAFRRQLLEINPFYWLASRDRFKAALVWLWMGAGAALWMFGLIQARRDWLSESTYVITALSLHSFFKCWIAIEASRRLGLDRASGALELLLSTPLSVGEILRGQWLALLRQFGAAIALVCAVDFLFLGVGLKHVGQERGEWILFCLAGISVFVMDLVTLALLGMWLSLKSRKPTRAGLVAIGLVCLVPWAIFGAFMAFVAVLEIVFHRGFFNTPNSERTILGVWFGICVATDLLLGLPALHKLRTRFRQIAIERPEARLGFWNKRTTRRPS